MRDCCPSLTAIAVLASFALLAPANTAGQRMPARTMAPLPAPAVGHTGYVHRAPSNGIHATPSRARTARANTVATAQGGNGVSAADSSGFGYPLSIQDLLNITPTNGFNWQYVNAINQDLPIQALINPVTQLEVAQAERLLRSTGGAYGGAYLLGGGGYGYYAPPETEGEEGSGEQQAPPPSQPAQPQVIVLQQAPAQQAPEEGSAATAEEQIPDQGQLTLVLRNGKQIQAVAFTHAGDEILYITPNGSRLSIPTSELNPDATVRINQEKGTPLQLNL
ncbi:MAG TPA: hypothetical protein VEJ67_16285 [Candidatus Cybelea sp.]|nr:hypothetical protein [Candidatus Cybelea sp.]